MKVWVILYTYNGYDGDFERLESNDDDKYMIFSSREKAEKELPKSDRHNLWFIKEVDVL